MIKVTYWIRPFGDARDVIYHVKEFKKWTLFRRIWLVYIQIFYDEIVISGSQE